MEKWRFLDTGRLSASENMALDEVLLECRARGESPNTVRVMQFSNPSVLVGFNQSVEQEARVDYCLESGIDINRRITGGGAIFFDRTQIGWEVICEKSFLGAGLPSTTLFESICEPVVQAIRELGIRASFRPRNDIEVDGRKISGTGGTDEGDALLFQGTLLVDFDVDSMLRALRVPVEKLKAKELESAKDRVTCLKWELGHVPGPEEIKSLLKRNFESAFRIELVDGGLTREEEILFNERKLFFKSPGWVHKVKSPGKEQITIHSIHKGDGGIIRTAMNVNLQQKRIKSVLITGDFFSFPRRTILDLEAELKDVKADIGIISEKVEHFFERTDCTVPGFGASDFVEGVKKCLDKVEITRFGIPLHLANRINAVNATFASVINDRPKHLLLPYCAKSPDCEWRYNEGCAECGE
ncbi:MAG: lipoate--protein ligase family protein, partial [Candidatus Thermoplasmatota archaeon]|nr:lipoate--protein ligase family protein [Candidatus Thermoplasmatota archaeon]